MVVSQSGISAPTFDRLMWPTLQALKQIGGSATIQEIEALLPEVAELTEEQQSFLHGSGPQTEVSYRSAWARTYLKAVGALQNSARGVWAITEYGRSLRESDMRDIPARVRATLPKKQSDDAAKGVLTAQPQDTQDPAESNGAAEEQGWRSKLIQMLQSMSPAAFERLCQRVLREEGFVKVTVTGRTGDGGIDGIGVLRLALLNFQIFFQCKRYKGSVGAAAIRDFRGAMVGRTDKGLLITTGTFTADAKREATRDGAPVLDLIDGDQLCDILKTRNLGVSTRLVEEVMVQEDWFAEL